MSNFKKILPNTLLGIADYLTQKNSLKPITLGMTMQVKNEVDIVELNIRYHAKRGVDKFFIVDNGSTDGTWETLVKLSSDYDMHLIRYDNPNVNQAGNMTKLSNIAKKKGMDFCIQNDADEFWYPHSGCLKTYLSRKDTTLRTPRLNVLPLATDPDNYLCSPWVVGDVVYYDDQTIYSLENCNLLLHNVSHKIITNNHGLLSVHNGNHSAKHVIDHLKRVKFGSWNNNITVFHFALRSFKQFQSKVNDRSKAIDYDVNTLKLKKHRHGSHIQAWCEANIRGELYEAYQQMLLKPSHIEALEKLHIISKNEKLIADFKKLNLI